MLTQVLDRIEQTLRDLSRRILGWVVGAVIATLAVRISPAEIVATASLPSTSNSYWARHPLAVVGPGGRAGRQKLRRGTFSGGSRR